MPRPSGLPRSIALVFAAFLALPIASLARPVDVPKAPLPPPGDKSNGEEEQIREREDWFYQRRGLDRIADAGARRAAAIEAVRAAIRSGRAVSTLAWQSLGPDAMTMLDWAMGLVVGRVDAFTVDPNDATENTLYLGAAAGGVWKSTDGGAHWSSIFDQVGTETIGAIYVEPGNAQHVLVGTGEHVEGCYGYFGMGLFESNDGGANFHPLNGTAPNNIDLSYVQTIGKSVDAQSHTVWLVGGLAKCVGGSYQIGGLFRSIDAGATWTRVATGYANDLVIDPTNVQTMYLAMGSNSDASNGVWKSTDAGATWSQLTTDIPHGTSLQRIRLAMAPSDSSTLYALVNQSATHIWKTTNGGANWTDENSNACEGQCWYDLTIAVHPTTPTTILVGSIRFATSTNSGSTLTYLTAGWGGSQKVHQDTHIVRYSATTANRFWVGSDGGFWRTDNGDQPPGSIAFTNLNATLNITQYYDLAIDPTDPTRVFGGAQDNSSSRRTTDPVWDTTFVTGDGFENLVDPANPLIVFQTSYPESNRPYIIKSDTGGDPNSFNNVSNSGIATGPFPWVTPLAVAPVAGNPSFAYVASNVVYRGATNQNAGSFHWTPISTNLTGNSSNAVSVMTPVGNAGAVRLYVGTDNARIWRSDNAGSPLPAFVNVTGNFPGGAGVTDVAADRNASTNVFATIAVFGSPKLYRSESGGTTWVAVGNGLPDVPANAVEVDPRGPHRIFVGTDVGVFVSTDNGDNFVPLMSGLPLGVPVMDFEVDSSPHTLVAGTYGRGAWRLDLDDLQIFDDGFESADTSAWSLTLP